MAHTFHIPVMGTGFTIDAPLHVARYGISSVISLVDDILIEQMRKYHSAQSDEAYEPIDESHEDPRATRIRMYLDLLQKLINRQVEQLKASPFEPGTEITRYFEMLPESPLRDAYHEMLATVDPQERAVKQDQLRERITTGNVDVNIMSKGDRQYEGRPLNHSDAQAALRGFATSRLNSAIVFSAGMNPRLYNYTAEFDDFFPDESGRFQKKIILKVSDYHSAAVQGKYLAKRGLWVSEYRIESGVNCGGHAFAGKGYLLGPILEEFQKSKQELVAQLHKVLCRTLNKMGRPLPDEPLPVKLSVQGGIGTAEEDQMLRDCYGANATGWATPFLLVPEVTNVDQEHLDKLCRATADDIYMSDSSPFGLPFWNLRTSSSEETRKQAIAEGTPGRACTKGYLKLYNTEFTEKPICTASKKYQKIKLQQLEADELTHEQRDYLRQQVLNKSCICNDLAGGAMLKNDIDRNVTPAICPGPNIMGFTRTMTLEEMVGHIYGRISLMNCPNRPHMFVKELTIYIEYLRKELEEYQLGVSTKTAEYFNEFRDNLRAGVDHYVSMAARFSGEAGRMITGTKTRFLNDLNELRELIESSTCSTPTMNTIGS